MHPPETRRQHHGQARRITKEHEEEEQELTSWLGSQRLAPRLDEESHTAIEPNAPDARMHQEPPDIQPYVLSPKRTTRQRRVCRVR